ncbi:MAG: cation transporter [Candidatus Geothermarchaeales archaeon]
MRLRLKMVGVSCASCIVPIRKALERTEGVRKVGANYVADLILIDYDPDIIGVKEITSIIEDTGYEAVPMMR